MPQTLTAQDLFRAAYENRYTWDSSFPGYGATVTLKDRGVTHRGQVRINPDLTFEVLNIENETAQRMVKSQLWEITIHRARQSFTATHGDNTFKFGKTDETGAVEILVGGAAMGNRYKVRNNTVCFVHRQIRDVVVNIHTFDTLMTDEGYLSTGYRSVYLDPETGVRKGAETTFEDTFAKVDGYYLLVRRSIQTEENGDLQVTELQFSNLKLLLAAV
ncbi:MAG: DUF3386 domain-containing protein [Cyanobacteria bacterium P01_H01_bin.58]